jgi:thymidylate synthase (FAD)
VIRSGHHSVLEHEKVTVRFIVDRGVSHELVRHRIASYSQESTRYCNYNQDRFGKEITVIEPWFFRPTETAGYQTWKAACEGCERAYFELLEGGATPQEARSVLPNSLKTEVVMTANLREWRHFLQLRCAKDAHPQMKEVAIPLLFWFSEQMLAVFGGIAWDFDFLPRWCAEVKKEGNK